MGVPKFFRWLSERYPAISQLIAENRIPEFDCLYLDMNGIIHNCTHKDTHDTSFRLSEEEMFIRIFNYIEHLFGKIKPKQLFFMAIDGVAPRAKMNQQRARRFRTARDAEEARDRALREGKELPTEEPFDSNCITPGTAFMANLSEQLKYFVNKKVSEDKEWQGCEVVLSGHEVPGEGEHKIMEYIRSAKAQPDYNPNVRHCLYGLDADLIMLGLLSHDPHFCLLREEVTFGRQSQTKSKELEHQNFYLLHLCIVREYLSLEFQDLKAEGAMSFAFDMEKVIDDFILMAFFVGNDFLPNLPHLHINEGALALMFRIYKEVLPRCDGYINEGGTVNLKRLGLLLERLGKEEYRYFDVAVQNENWFRAKREFDDNPDGAASRRPRASGHLAMTTAQKNLWKHTIRPWVSKREPQTLNLGHGLKAEDRKFVQELAKTFRLQWTTVVDEQGDRDLVLELPNVAGRDADGFEEEGRLATFRIIRKYDSAEVVDVSPEDARAAMEAMYQQKFQDWKNQYYAEKFDWTDETKEEGLRALTENYVQGLQWVLYYYYRGIRSWPWYYASHYSPMISDVSKGLGADMNFKLGQPFRPFEQLMGVLPDRSKKIVPTVYWELMTDPASPIIDFYPRDFELDMNGKKQDWEAVVKIPFIEERRLLDAMAPKNLLLSEDEKARNDFGVALKFTFSPTHDFVYPSSLAGIFPDIPHCRCVMNIFDLPPVDGLEFLHALTDGALLNEAALAGFPSLHTLPYTASLGFHGVNVFQQESRNESMVVTLSGTDKRTKVEVSKQKLGQRCHVGYPFLQEAKVVRVSDELCSYTLDGQGRVVTTPHSSARDMEQFAGKARRIEEFYSRRLGIIVGPVESMVHVHMLKGLIKTEEGATVKEYGDIPGMETDYAAQVIVDGVINEDQRFIERAALPIEEEFALGSQAFFLGDYAYGRPLEVIGHVNNKLEIRVLVLKKPEPDFVRNILFHAERNSRYLPSYAVAKMLELHPLALSRITASFFVLTMKGSIKVNLGLNLKFEGKKMKVLGYSRKSESGWEFSPSAIALLTQYMQRFPDLFAVLKKVPSGNEVKDTDLWPDDKVANSRVKEIGAWLKTLETSKFEKVPLDAEQLDSDVVMQLASAADSLQVHGAESEVKVLKGTPRSALLKPEDAEQRLGNQNFALGDRVVYVQQSGKVPIAMKGTVVGISRTPTAKLLDVVFDITFMSGSTLGERCPPFRGQTVASTSVLNVTNRQVVIGSKAMLQRKPLAPSLTTLSSAATGFSPNGTRQYRDAPAPAPLQGSWRGAAGGDPRGGGLRVGGSSPGPRRGGGDLQHSTLVYRNGRGGGGSGGRGGSNGLGPNGYPEGATPLPGSGPSYNNVPPPAILNAPSPGRGGGRGRGRGVQGVRGGGRGGGEFRGGRLRGGRGGKGSPASRGAAADGQ